MPKTLRRTVRGVVIGRIAGLHGSGDPVVDFEANSSEAPVRARSVVTVTQEDVGTEVVLLFEASRPIVMGFLRPDRRVLSAPRELVLKCGKAEITLTKAGKILIRGTYVSSRSSGVNRVKGASVQIN